jgi:putative tryptophan/tyrosine transport system substrate-binding protein
MRKAAVPAIFAILVLLAAAIIAEAQEAKKIYRIGYLSAFDAPSESSRAAGVRLALRERGYIEGQNIAIEYRYATGKRERYAELAAELVHLKVDLIVVAGGVIPIQAAKNATRTIPIVMTGVGADPVKFGLVESLARPGGNVTGFTNFEMDLGEKRLELLKDAVPKLARVAVLYDPAIPSASQVKDDLPVAARALGLTIQLWEIRAAEGLDRFFASLNKERPDGLYASSSLVIAINRKRIADFALKSRLPSTHGVREAADVGGLMYYGPDLTDTYRRVAYYMDRILKGAKPSDLPVEQAKKFELIINLNTAKQIGVNIPQTLLYRADKVIK